MSAMDWLDRRTGIRAVLRFALDEPVPGGARWRYVFGSVLAFLFMQQVVLGILLATYYSPSASDAWASTAYLNDRVAGGWFLRGLHHHGSSAMVVVVILHMAQVVWAGAYRAPREVSWWSGVAMGLVVLAFALTGYLLPWDQKGYWATQVATGILGTVPLGDVQQQLLQGGAAYGNLTLTRFYVLHVFVLPISLAGLLGVHLWVFRKHGVTPPAAMNDEELERTSAPFWPNQLMLDVLAMALTGAVLAWLTYQTHGADLFAPADPASNFVARPEWYFLFLFQLLKYFHGPAAIIGTVIVPGAALVFLLALPFLDRAKSRRARDRMPVLIGVATLMAAVVALTVLALKEDAVNESYQEGLELAHAQGDRSRELAKLGVPPSGGISVMQNDPEYLPRELFAAHCGSCHELEGDGGGDSGEGEAPTFTRYGDRAWLSGAIRTPQSNAYFGGTEDHDTMPAYDATDLPDAQLAAVVEYLLLLRGDVEVDPTLAAAGVALWEGELDCNGCHATAPRIDGQGSPGMLGRGRTSWLTAVITDSSRPDLFGVGAKMPKFGETLERAEIEALAAFIESRGALVRIEEPPPVPEAPWPTAPGDAGSPPVVADPTDAPADAPTAGEGQLAMPSVEDGAVESPDARPSPKPKPKSKPAAGPKPAPKPSADLANGKTIFNKKCKSCHGTDGKGETTYGKKIGVASLLTSKLSKSQATAIVKNGKSGTKMKGYATKLSADEIRDVVAYARRF